MCRGWGGGRGYSICILEFLSISEVWDVCFLDFIVLESKGSFFHHDFANEQHFWDYGTFQKDYSTFRGNCPPTPPLSSSEKKVLKGHNTVVF